MEEDINDVIEEENEDKVNVADDDEIKNEASLTDKKTENPHVQDVRNSQEGVQNLDLPPPFLILMLPFELPVLRLSVVLN